MKKFRVLSSVLASALMMTVMSCSSSDDLNGGGADANDKSYLAIRINNVGSVAGSRAASDYSDGTADENHIESVRFYFFNSDDDRMAAGSGCAIKVDTDPADTENSMLICSHRKQVTPVQWNFAVDHELFQCLPAAGDAHRIVCPARTEQDLYT